MEARDAGRVSECRAMRAAASMRARVITCFRNGKQFEHGIRVSFVLGKTFPDLDHLMDHLTQRCTDIPNGVRYIFTTTGKMVLRLEDLEHGQPYVISGVKQFHFLSYGQQPVSDSSLKSFSLASRPSPLDLLPSPATGKFVTLVNGRRPSVRSRVFLNLRTPKPFESVLKDLGDSVHLANPKILLNERGTEVRLSHDVSKA